MKFPRVNFPELRLKNSTEIAKLIEIKYRLKFRENLLHLPSNQIVHGPRPDVGANFSNEDLRTIIDGGILTFLLHCEARIASSLGLGFYTIGPCGEELLGAVALHLRPTDASALHYRHVSTSITRQLRSGKSISEVGLSRARGFVCSSLDPVTGGKHCAIGGSSYDYIVSSTLASQAPPAVGRALGIALSNKLLLPDRNLEGGNGNRRPAFPPDAISYVSFGDGSVNNAHFLTALNLAKYSQHRGVKCPVVFAISDNGKCISLSGHGWIQKFVRDCGISHYIADGTDLLDVHTKSKAAIDFTRLHRRPCVLLFENLPRRFGHAATDRQAAYMTAEEITSSADNDPLSTLFNDLHEAIIKSIFSVDTCQRAVAAGHINAQQLLERYDYIAGVVEAAFDTAVVEPKVTSRESLVAQNSAPHAPRAAAHFRGTLLPKSESRQATSSDDVYLNLCRSDSTTSEFFKYVLHGQIPTLSPISDGSHDSAPATASTQDQLHLSDLNQSNRDSAELIGKAQASALHSITGQEAGNRFSHSEDRSRPIGEVDTMRKHMTRLFDELLRTNTDMVYIGEDVQHGGYYLVTEGLAKSFPLRVRDFPPDETSLIGVAMGYSQSGLVPIVEIPYAKYLDCAADMFLEAVNTYWLSNGSQSVGMLIRLQGFDKGLFGGNYHTHNSIPLPPGLDVVCYSNGADYVRGLRYVARQIRAGRVVLCVDSTHLLTRRHLSEEERDKKWLTYYPSTSEGDLAFDDVIVYQQSQEGTAEDGPHGHNDHKNTVNGRQLDRKSDLDNSNEDRAHMECTAAVRYMSTTVAVVTYGNGVPTSLLALSSHFRSTEGLEVASKGAVSKEVYAVVDCPCLSQLPAQLEEFIRSAPSLHSVVFADVCKLHTAPLSTYAVQLQNKGIFTKSSLRSKNIQWTVIGASDTYNPLGNTITFLSEADINAAVTALLRNNTE